MFLQPIEDVWPRSWRWFAVLSFLFSGVSAGGAEPPSTDPSSRATVTGWVRLLNGDPDQRRQAEDALRSAGPVALRDLPALSAPGLSAAQRQSLEKLLPDLWRQQRLAELAGREFNVTDENLPYADALDRFESATGVRLVDARPRDLKTQPAVTLNLERASLWKYADALAAAGAAEVVGQSASPAWTLIPKRMGRTPTIDRGAFRLAIRRISQRIDFPQTEAPPDTLIQLEAIFDPRLRLLQVEAPAKAVSAVDDRDQRHEAPAATIVATSANASGFLATIPLRPKDARSAGALRLTKFDGALTLSMPAAVESFQSPALSTKTSWTESQRAVELRLLPVVVDGDLWSIVCEVAENPCGLEVDSHWRARLSPALTLMGAQGAVHKPAGASSIPVANGRTRHEFLFTGLRGKPGDYQAKIEAPVGLLRLPIDFAFENLPLP